MTSLNTTAKKKLLIVEDDLALRGAMAELFEPLDADVFMASNGYEALQLLQDQTVDAIISDIRMPVMDGVELIREIRSRGIETPFIFLTGYGDKMSAISAVKHGAYAFFEKPFNIDSLMTAVSEALILGCELRTLEQELDQICADRNNEDFRRAQRAVLLLKKQRKVSAG